MAILASSLPQMNQLVRLTEAIRGKHTIDDPDVEYDEWNEWARKKNELEEAKRKREQRVLRRQLRAFAKEKNPGLEVDERLERRHDSLIPKPKDEGGLDGDWEVGMATTVATGGSLAGGDLCGDEGTLYTSGSEADYENEREFAHVEPSKYDTDSENDHNDFARKRGRTKEAKGPSNILQSSNFYEDDDLPVPIHATNHNTRNHSSKVGGGSAKAMKRRDSHISHALLPKTPAKKAKVSSRMEKDSALSARYSSHEKQPARKIPPDLRKSPPEMNAINSAASSSVKEKSTFSNVAAASASSKASQKAPPKSKIASPDTKRTPKAVVNKGRPPKKCHHCKITTTHYRNCNYWKLTGKCRKIYCIDCLSSKYTLGNDKDVSGVSIDDIVNCPAYDAEWHCPSCLGTCQCIACVKERKKEEDREKSRNEAAAGRKSRSRRSAANAGNSYSYFF
mmetsp:Transcript_361/g.709  ORF Transcript_361/g.709 Transcript_361/m.709 type:complete len:450 (+) Transcript_361:664-2013(+)|eukprot:CAMPEP_0201612704 /NCGR_PEP_ID=MMETSP0492-20130828/23900_1 /ASSEMBLY_ACC=CAM_ASM_000837 /TAXON_ID=420259 /ORGANISM="Thalassiosira gravida, Strain GMp14c1" /LENGTH=449 /DNA_ID=CAMNT_0048079317 /DNA_START=504 /DNA_END=1853 /DNA_ORIENTATION=-